MNSKDAASTVETLRALGFDLSMRVGGLNKAAISIRCSQCEALVINGIPAHELGCPNMTRPCRECGEPTANLSRVCDDCGLPVIICDDLD